MGIPGRITAGMAIALALPGCVAKTAWNVATAPVKVGSKAVDLATTSQSEADEKRGRDLRKREEQLGELQRRYEREMGECERGNRYACDDAPTTRAEIQELSSTVPAAPQ